MSMCNNKFVNICFDSSGILLSPHCSMLHPKTMEAMMRAQNLLWGEING